MVIARLRSNDTMRYKAHPHGGPHIVAAIPPHILLKKFLIFL